MAWPGSYPRSGIIRRALAAALAGLPATIIQLFQPAIFLNSYRARLALLLASGALAALVSTARPVEGKRFLKELGRYILFSAALYALANRLALVTDYPFPQYWSEGNRFYDYSTLFAADRYLTPDGNPPYAFTSTGMALPFTLPFLLPDIKMRAYRLYYQLMWVLPALFLGTSLYTSLIPKKGDRFFSLATAAAFAYAFIEQGPVYPALILASLIVVLGFRIRNPFRYLFTLIAAVYAHYARWTWSFAPGVWAALLALMEVDGKDIHTDFWSALREPFLHAAAGIVGGLVLPFAFGSEMAGVLTNPLPFTARQPLLWYRLLPNNTFPAGVLVAAVWAGLPVLIAIIYLSRRRVKRMHWLHWAAITLVLIGFFTVGLVASVKIGGGSNLHNLDMFLITLLLLVFVFASRLTGCEDNPAHAGRATGYIQLLVTLGIATFLLTTPVGQSLPISDSTTETLQAARIWAEKGEREGEVLFIDHRQLLTFGYIEGVELVDAYEKKLLMEMAMSASEAYFTGFHRDIAAKRFAVIINEPLFLEIQTGGEAFMEENNAYVRWVSRPLACYYYPVYTSDENRLQILIPRRQTPANFANCPAAD